MLSPMNRDSFPEDSIDFDLTDSGRKLWMLGAACGSEKIYVNILHLPPGAKSGKYHSHSCQEEFFYVLAGTPTLRLDEKIFALKPGYFFAKPSGKGIAHQFANESDEACEILEIGSVEPEDISIYPDEGAAMVRSLQKVFSLESGIKGWKSNLPGMD